MDRGERRMIFPRWNIKQHLLCVCKSTSTIVLVVAMAHDSTKNHCCVSLAPWSANYISIWNLHFFLWIFLPSAIKNLLFLRDFHASENFISRYSRRVVGIRRKKKLLTLQLLWNSALLWNEHFEKYLIPPLLLLRAIQIKVFSRF